MGKHSDDGPEGGSDPFIMSLSLGCTRKMVFSHKLRKESKTLELVDGSLVVMLGPRIQENWKHGVTRDDGVNESRWNVSLRFHLKQWQFEQVHRIQKKRLH